MTINFQKVATFRVNDQSSCPSLQSKIFKKNGRLAQKKIVKDIVLSHDVVVGNDAYLVVIFEI